MKLEANTSIEHLQRSLVLYRKLLSLIPNPGSETEVARAVVDMLFEEFPDFRLGYTLLKPNLDFHVVYSRQHERMKNLSGLRAKLPPSKVSRQLLDLKMLVIDDVRTHPQVKEISDELMKIVGSVARLDFPIEKKENGDVVVISLTHAEPQAWSGGTIQLLAEVAELVHLLLREARTRERLKESETLFQQFTGNIPYVFWVVEPLNTVEMQKIVYVSPAYEEVWGHSVEALRQDPLNFLRAIHPDDRERIRTAVSGARTGPYEQYYRVLRPDGSVRWIRDRGYPIFDETGRMTRNLGIAEDITALHLAEEQLEATRAQVVSNAKFAALGEMAGGIAHEINNPLAVISGLTQQIRELQERNQLLPGDLRDKIDTLERMTSRIAGIVKGLRTFSRRTEGDPFMPADVCGILFETLSFCDAKIQAAAVKLDLAVAAAPIPMKCRASEISQVILNLLNNAIDAVAQSQEKIVSLRLEAKGNTIFLTVEDSGPGVNEKIREQIFQPFFTTKEVGKGTGLGLSISKGIVEAHGGKLTLDSSGGRTRFVVQLPGSGN